MPVRVQWFDSVERMFTTTVPAAAHAQATVEAAGAAARGIKSTYTGTLARHVSVPAFIALMFAEVGSGPGGRAPLVYGAIEHFGGTIQGRPLLYIHDRRATASGGTTRSTYAGPVVAIVPRVYHQPKGYLNAALSVFPARFIMHLEARLPG